MVDFTARLFAEYEHEAFDFDSYPDDLDTLKRQGIETAGTTDGHITTDGDGRLSIALDLLGHRIKVTLYPEDVQRIGGNNEAAEALDRIREMLGLQGSDEDVPEALGKYLVHLERLLEAKGGQEGRTNVTD